MYQSTYQLQSEPNYYSNIDISPLLDLLSKAEQILSIINLSDFSVCKYNELKRLTFDKLGLPFVPLIKKYCTNQPNINLPPSPETELLLRNYYFLHAKKSLLIDLLLKFIDSQSNEGVMEIKPYLQSLTDVYNLLPVEYDKKSLGEIECEYSFEMSNLADLFTRTDNVINENFEKLMKKDKDFKCKIMVMNEYSDKQNYNLKEYACQKQTLEKELEMTSENLRKMNEINDKLTLLIEDIYSQITPNAQQSVQFECDLLQKLEKIKEHIYKINSDNSHYMSIIPNLQEEKLDLYKKMNMPFVSDVINKSSAVEELTKEVDEILLESDELHTNFGDVIKYIRDNIEEKLI